jgi:hypothetical protein
MSSRLIAQETGSVQVLQKKIYAGSARALRNDLYFTA